MYVGRMVSKTLYGVSFLLIGQSAFAEDLMGFYQKALQNDPQMLGAKYTHRAAGELTEEAFGRFLPQLGFEYSISTTKQDTLTSGNTLFQPLGEKDFDTKDYSLTLTQPLYNSGIYGGYEQAKSNVLRADAELESIQQDFILRTVERYLEALAATDASGFAAAEKAAVGKQLELVRNMTNSGLARKTDLYDSQARYAAVEADEVSVNNARDDKLQALREMVGELTGELTTLKDELDLVYPEPENPEQWMQLAVKQNPRVTLQKRALDVSKQEVDLQKANHKPTLNLTARLNKRDTEDSLIGSGDNVIETSDILLRLNIPIYNGGIVSSRVRNSQELVQKARQDLTEVQRAVLRAARAGYYGIISAISRVGALSKSVRAQQLSLDSKQLGYRSGLYTSLDVLDAERDLYEAKRDYARARYEYLINGLRLKHAVGTLSSTDVEGVNSWLQ